jgi:Bardet-Biedl syndrome 2 protein
VVPLRPFKNVAVTLDVQVLVCARGTSQHMHVFRVAKDVPRFLMYAEAPPSTVLKEQETKRKGSFVTFSLQRSLVQVGTALDKLFCFLNKPSLQTRLESVVSSVCLCMQSLRDESRLLVQISKVENSQSCCGIEIQCDSMELAAELIHELANMLGLDELSTHANFASEMSLLQTAVSRVEDLQAGRLRHTAEIADHTMHIKDLVVKAEDSRLLYNMDLLKSTYQELYGVNADLMQEHSKRATNHQALLDVLKEINALIQRASRLRVGKAQKMVVDAARSAIKKKNFTALAQIVATGGSGTALTA